MSLKNDDCLQESWNVTKVLEKDLVCHENLPKSPEILLKKSCDPLTNQSQI